jgi:hypothetical protein
MGSEFQQRPKNHVAVHMCPELIIVNVLVEQKAIKGLAINYFI